MTTNPDIETDIPIEVYAFFKDLNRAVYNGDAGKMHDLYEAQFDTLTKNYYTAGHGQFHSWPPLRLEQVSSCFKGNKEAELVYGFLFYKHLFTDNRAVRAIDAEGSWTMFTELLAALPSCSLPSWMLWDIFDEFLYQMTVVYQKLYNNENVWAVPAAIKALDEVIERSNFTTLLHDSEQSEDILKGPQTSILSGFYAVITKAKLDVLLGDYYAALQGLKSLDTYRAGRTVLNRVSPAAVSLYYHIGFSYLMIHRFEDASNAFRRSVQVKLTGRRFTERVQMDAAYMYVCARVLGGMHVTNISAYLDSRKVSSFEDDREVLRTGDEERFREIFERCSPKFLTVPPTQGSSVKGTEGRELQARMFRRVVQQQQEIIRLRGYFRVYQNTNFGLIETLLGIEDATTALVALKMRSRQLVHDGENADLLQGEYKVSSEYDCIVKGDNVEVVPSMSFGSVEQKLLMKIKGTQREIDAAERKFHQRRRREEDQERRKAQGKDGRDNQRKRQGTAAGGNNRPPVASQGGINNRNRASAPTGGGLFDRNTN